MVLKGFPDQYAWFIAVITQQETLGEKTEKTRVNKTFENSKNAAIKAQMNLGDSFKEKHISFYSCGTIGHEVS